MLTRDFFSKPIVIPVTFLNNNLADGVFSQVEEKVYFKLRREKGRESDEATKAALFGDSSFEEVRLKRLCNLLTEAPEGFGDFPDDGRQLRDRAEEYFAGDDFEPVIRAVMLFYDRCCYPLEMFR